MLQQVRRALRIFIAVAMPLVGLLCLIGHALRDRNAALQWLFFLPPLPAAIGCGLCAWRCRSRSRGWRIASAAIALACMAVVLCRDVHWAAGSAPAASDMRLVHWNVARGRTGWDGILDCLQADRPDLLVLSETGNDTNLPQRIRAQLNLPFVHMEQGLALASRYPIIPRGPLQITSGRGWNADAMTPQGVLRIAVVDIASRPGLNRTQAANSIREWVDRVSTNQPLLVVGDFNTPRDALAFTPLRGRLLHAYEKAGSGWPYTWPMPLPCYQLDHVWFSGSIRAYAQRHRWSLCSDHLRQEVSLHIQTKKPGSSLPLFVPPPFPQPRPH